MNLHSLLDTLSRSSAQAVRTLGNQGNDTLKDYLYIQTAIETAFHDALQQADTAQHIIFLCGSSGDGKSEILTRYYNLYQDRLDFHLDATHSFQPDMSAIETIDHKFAQHQTNNRPLVIGINIGLLGNYAEEGSDDFADIKTSIKAFLDDRISDIAPQHVFLDFEQYPKFLPNEAGVTAPFIDQLLKKLTQETDDNPFYQAWKQEAGNNSTLNTNYRLLQYPEVQQIIIQVLLKVRLKYEQFLTARTLLDFIHHILTGDGYLFDNLFSSHKTELCSALCHFDPCTIRSRAVDLFLIQKSLNITDTEFETFREQLSGLICADNMQTGSWIRLFYLIQNIDLGNNFHHTFRDDFQSQLYDEYIRIWLLHYNYDGSATQKKALRKFYQKDLLEAIFRFANRFAPELSRHKQLFLADYNGYQLSTRAELKESLKRISENRPKRLGSFNTCLKLGDTDLEPIPVSANFLDLIMKINQGYRPNKHDKNNIVILEELIDDITRKLRDSNTLTITRADQQWTLTNDLDEDEITVEG